MGQNVPLFSLHPSTTVHYFYLPSINHQSIFNHHRHRAPQIMASTSSSSTVKSSDVSVVNGDGALLSDYEQWRAKNIERNNAKLRQLGLIGQEEEQLSNDLAWGRRSSSNEQVKRKQNADEDYIDEEGAKKDTKRRRKAETTSSPPREGSRKSRRLANQPAEGEEEGGGGGGWKSDKTLSTMERRAALVAECREARQRAAIEVAKAGFKMAAKENPTASYEHCLMRVRSMTEKALAARVRRTMVSSSASSRIFDVTLLWALMLVIYPSPSHYRPPPHSSLFILSNSTHKGS